MKRSLLLVTVVVALLMPMLAVGLNARVWANPTALRVFLEEDLRSFGPYCLIALLVGVIANSPFVGTGRRRMRIVGMFAVILVGATLTIVSSETTMSSGHPPTHSHTIGIGEAAVDSRLLIQYLWGAYLIGCIAAGLGFRGDQATEQVTC